LTAAAGVVQDLTVQVEHHLAASIWNASSGDCPDTAAINHDATAAAGTPPPSSMHLERQLRW
jgi:hypothetical protein